MSGWGVAKCCAEGFQQLGLSGVSRLLALVGESMSSSISDIQFLKALSTGAFYLKLSRLLALEFIQGPMPSLQMTDEGKDELLRLCLKEAKTRHQYWNACLEALTMRGLPRPKIRPPIKGRLTLKFKNQMADSLRPVGLDLSKVLNDC